MKRFNLEPLWTQPVDLINLLSNKYQECLVMIYTILSLKKRTKVFISFVVLRIQIFNQVLEEWVFIKRTLIKLKRKRFNISWAIPKDSDSIDDK